MNKTPNMSIEIIRNEDGTLTDESSKQMADFQYEYTKAVFEGLASLSVEQLKSLFDKGNVAEGLADVITDLNQKLIDAEYPMAALGSDGGIHRFAEEAIRQISANVAQSFNLTTEHVFANVCGREDFGLVTTKDVSDVFKRVNAEKSAKQVSEGEMPTDTPVQEEVAESEDATPSEDAEAPSEDPKE